MTIASTGNATDFGDLSAAKSLLSGLASATRGIFGGGDTSGGSGQIDVIEYITIASTGDVTDFGNFDCPSL